MREGALQVQGDGRQILGQGVVDLPREARALFGAGQTRPLLRQAGAVHGVAHLIADGREQAHLHGGQRPPCWRGNVHS